MRSRGRSQSPTFLFYRGRFPSSQPPGFIPSIVVQPSGQLNPLCLEGRSQEESSLSSSEEEEDIGADERQRLMQEPQTSERGGSGHPSYISASQVVEVEDDYDEDGAPESPTNIIQIDVPKAYQRTSSSIASGKHGRMGRRFTLNPLIFAKVGYT
uniref:Uncharacterized protein n=1 Tax=Ditylenchus dipsaci TaxID=166011 RepID=A0A915DZK3_9BILA